MESGWEKVNENEIQQWKKDTVRKLDVQNRLIALQNLLKLSDLEVSIAIRASRTYSSVVDFRAKMQNEIDEQKDLLSVFTSVSEPKPDPKTDIKK